MDSGDDAPVGSRVLPAEEALRLRDRSVAAARNGIIIADATLPDTPMIDVNPAVERITGYPAPETLGRNCRMFQGPGTDPAARARIGRALREERECAVTLLNYRRDGAPFWNDLHIAPVRDDAGRLTHFVGVLDDVTERKRLEDQLLHQAFHDPLTGLPNRALFTDRLERALVRGVERGEGVAVLFVDLDGFKFVNDGLGHEAGDRLLAVVAERLRAGLSPTEMLARFGGDEFTLLLEGVDDPGAAERVGERVVAALRPPVPLDGREVRTSASVGIALGGVAGDRPSDLLRHADIALYRAKRRGKARVELFDPSLPASAERLRLEEDLRGAVARGELILHYQPRVDLATGRVLGLEALVRWRHPERGLIPPASFIPIAEETGLIAPLGRWVLAEACRQMREWAGHGSGSALSWVSVNLSARQLQDPGLVGEVARALADSGLAPHYLELEVTESAALEDGEATADALAGLKGLGVELAIDDFGAGYASLAHLRRLPVDHLKIDRSLVAGLGRQPDTALVAATVDMAHALGLRVTGEGVETRGQWAHLRELGCDLGQGYLFAEPLPAEDVRPLLGRPVAPPPPPIGGLLHRFKAADRSPVPAYPANGRRDEQAR